MGIRTRIKKLIKAQVRNRVGTFNVRSGEPVAPPPRAPEPKPAFLDDDRPVRRVIRAPLIVERAEAAPATDGAVRIKAQPARDGDDCTFLVDRPLLERGSWHFETSEDASQSPLPAAVFAVEGVETVVVDESTVVITRVGDEGDWRPLAELVGAAIREHVGKGDPALAQEIVDAIPDEDTLRTAIQRVIDEHVNPGVAAHNGHISLSRLRGNSVYIEMGGGCQGCSAAAVTLRQGIHTTFRQQVPGVGAIYDDTDHAAGINPYFS